MQRTYKWRPFLLLSFMLVLVNQGNGQPGTQPASPRIRKEIITVLDSARGFRREIWESNRTGLRNVYYIPYSSLETVKLIDFKYLDEAGNPLRSESPEISDIQIPTSYFYTCLRAKKIPVNEKSSFRIHYSGESSDLLLLASLSFTGNMTVDTFYYELRIPEGYHVIYDLPYPGMLSYFKADTLKARNYTVYSLAAVPKTGSKPGPALQTEDGRMRKKACMARVLITPDNYTGRESAYFNARMQRMYSASLHMNDTSGVIIDSLVKNCSSADSVKSRLFGFISEKIKYLGMEVGYGSFVPEDVNQVLKARQGDCKGKSTLLCQALRSRGIEAYPALAATISHSCDMDFPALSSGNHMICAVRSGDNWEFLDPTDKEGGPGMISTGIQGRTVFIVGYHDGIFVRVPVEKSRKNMESFDFHLGFHENQLSGTLVYTCTGGPKDAMNQLVSMAAIPSEEMVITECLRGMVQSSLPSNPTRTTDHDSIKVRCDISFSPSLIVTSNGISYISLALLPPPMQFTKQDRPGCDLLLGHAILKKVTVSIDFMKKLSPVKIPEMSYHEDGFDFDLSVSADRNIMKIAYVFRCENNIVPEQDLPKYRKFEAFLDAKLRTVIPAN